jgi:plasmid maintenance system antidote protein VapI
MEHMEQVEADMQQIPLRILQEIGEPDFVAEAVMNRIDNEADAISWCWALRRVRGMTQAEAARHLGIPKSHFSNIVAGKKYLPHDARILLQRLCGNWVIRQYEDKVCGFVTQRETSEQRRIRELEQQVHQLERKSA